MLRSASDSATGPCLPGWFATPGSASSNYRLMPTTRSWPWGSVADVAGWPLHCPR